ESCVLRALSKADSCRVSAASPQAKNASRVCVEHRPGFPNCASVHPVLRPDGTQITGIESTQASLHKHSAQRQCATNRRCKTRSNFTAPGNSQWPHLEELARTRRRGVGEIGCRSVPLRYTFWILDCDSTRASKAGRRAAFRGTFWYPLACDPCGRNAFRFFH